MGVVGGWMQGEERVHKYHAINDIKESIKRNKRRRRRKQTNIQQNACSSSLVHAPNKKGGKITKIQEHYKRKGASGPSPGPEKVRTLLVCVCGWSSAERTKSVINVDRCVIAEKEWQKKRC